ncbi:unnamed protein product [Cuscuta epithymum]|uniref:Uncharacterized protein n=1 Tax=Cuscuta epithymum TaxID=186058 RepID=A0AAV0EKQ8_9ASTE|nr:unnamed protein product [Cuscuta epithymum]
MANTPPATMDSSTISPNGDGMPANSPKGGQQCLCSPTTHQGSFRCRLHRSATTSSSCFKTSNSMPAKAANNVDLGSLSHVS